MTFTAIFVILLFFLIIFAESQLIFYLGGILAVFYLSQRRHLNFKQIELLKKKQPFFYSVLLISLSSILMLIFYLPINSYLGIAWSQSLSRYFSLLIGFASFIVFLFYERESSFDEEVLFKLLFKLMKLLSIVVLILMFSSRLANLLPKINLLYASYGHNHFATLLLLFLPYFWQNLILEKKVQNKSELYWLLFFYIVLILSFARIVIILAILQLLVLVFINFRQLKKLSLSKLKFIKNLAMFLLLIVIYFTALIFKFNSSPNKFCENKDSGFQHFCKDVTHDDRLIYWQHAMDFFKQKPLIGHGLNSFVLVFRNQARSDISVSKYVHNEFLQILSDTGLVGSALFFIPLLLFLILSIFFVFKKPSSKNQALLLGAVGLYAVAVFDFDWQFTVIFTLNLIFLALILRQTLFFNKAVKSDKHIHSKLFSLRLPYLIFFVSSFLVILISISHMTSELFRKFSLPNQAFRSLPLSEAPEYSATIDFFSQENQDLILDVYRNDVLFLLNYFEYTQDDGLKKRIYLRILDLNPKFLGGTNLFYFLKNSSVWTWEEKTDILLKIARWVNNEAVYLETKNLAIDARLKELVGPLLLEVADGAFLKNELELSGKFYYQYYLLNTWQPKVYKPAFLEIEGGKEHADFLKEFQKLDPDLFYQHYNLFHRFYTNVLIDLFFSLDYTNFEILTSQFMSTKFQDNFYDFSQDLMVILLRELGDDIQVQREKKQWLVANFMHFFIKYPDYPWPWEEKEKLARKLWRFYRQLELSEPDVAEQYKNDALTVAPEIAWQLSQIQ